MQLLRNSAIIAMITYVFLGSSPSKTFLEVNTNRFFILFAVMQTLSSTAIWITGGIETLNNWIKVGIIYFLITRLITDEAKLHKICMMIVLALVYLSYSSYSKYIFNYLPGMRAGSFGLYENPNDLSLILVSAIPLAVMLANYGKSTFVRIVFMGIAIIFTVNILFTGSRNGLLALLVIGVMSLFSADNIPKTLKTVLMVTFIGAILTVGVSNVLHREGVTGLRGDESSENRIIQWKAGARMLLHHPLIGVGRDQFLDRVEEFGGIRGLLPHNTIVQVFAETGFPGGIFFLLFTVYPLYAARRYFQRPNKDVPILPGVRSYRFIIAALAGFWICAFFTNRYQFYILYVLVALSVAVKNNIMEKQEPALADGYRDVPL